MTTPNYFVDIHILQDLPPSNINRDDNGTPKQCTYGGVQRLRVSSQSWKRSTRLAFEDLGLIPEENLGVRTRRVIALFAAEFRKWGVADDETATQLATAVVAPLKIKPGKKADQGAYLLFFSRPQVDDLVEKVMALREQWEPVIADTKALATIVDGLDVPGVVGHGHSLDVALFGRMVADLPEINVDAAAQVAHAISTHATQNQFDYFTAVDDFQNDSGSETGSGMIGTIEFNSATMYRFATVSTRQLSENLNDPSTTPQGVVDFIKAFALSMPTGHQTSYAAHTRPAAVVVSVRKDQPVNLVSAFEKPVWSPRQGMVEESELRLARFMQEEVTRWGDSPILVAACYAPVNDLNGEQKTLADVFGPSLSFADILDAVKVAISGDNPDD